MKPFGRPLVQAHGVGVDSMAVTIGLVRAGVRPDAIMFADTGGEKRETYEYQATLNAFLERHGFPRLTVVQYLPTDFKNWPPYHTLEQNCLTNGTMPSLAFGFKSCSLKWKAAPQDKWLKTFPPAVEAWSKGRRVTKLIGYDAGPKDMRRKNHAGNADDPLFEYRYPLQEWGWDRERCIEEIKREGLAVPMKSACFFCPAAKGHELRQYTPDLLRRIVLMEARAKPRLDGFMTQPQLDARHEERMARWEKRAAKARAAGKRVPNQPRPKTAGDPQLIRGLWRNKRMTEFIRAEGLLPAEEIDRLANTVPPEIVRTQELYREGQEIPTWDEFFEELDENGVGCYCPNAEEVGSE